MQEIMSIYEDEIEGREFDWFAIDSDGNIGLFSTAGEGPVPKLVIESYIEHDAISELLDSPNWGSSEVWSDYAALGFYVFDWHLHGGPYKREHDPTKSMSVDLKEKIMKTGILHNFSGKFPELEVVNDV